MKPVKLAELILKKLKKWIKDLNPFAKIIKGDTRSGISFFIGEAAKFIKQASIFFKIKTPNTSSAKLPYIPQNTSRYIFQ